MASESVATRVHVWYLPGPDWKSHTSLFEALASLVNLCLTMSSTGIMQCMCASNVPALLETIDERNKQILNELITVPDKH